MSALGSRSAVSANASSSAKARWTSLASTASATVLAGALAVSACSPASEVGPSEGSPQAGQSLTLERLYSLPRLIGTEPIGFAWSPQSTHLAFLWNDDGLNFRDVWVAATDSGAAPARWTRLPQSARPTDAVDPGDGAMDAFSLADAEDRRERDPGATAVWWHPGGERLLVAFHGDLWWMRAGEPPEEAFANAAQPAFSADGSALAFLRDGDLWLATADGQSERQLTSLASDRIRVESFRWSPAGAHLAILETDRSAVPVRSIPDYLTAETSVTRVPRAYPGEEPERQRIGILEVRIDDDRRNPPRWIHLAAPEPDMLLSYRWSPDGDRLAIDTSDLFAKDRRIFVVGVVEETGARVVARDQDLENETFYFWRIAWSRDGRQIYFLSDRETDYHVWSAPAGGGAATALTSGSWAVAEIFPVTDGLVAVGNLGRVGRGEERQLFWVSEDLELEGRAPARLSELDGTHTLPAESAVSPDGRWAAVHHSSDDSPPELLITSLDPGGPSPTGERERRVTNSPIPEFDDYRWVTPQYVSFPSHLDGSILHGRLTLPPDFDPDRTYPAILGSVYTDSVRNQWGGRTAHPTWGLDQYLAQQGYVLLNVDMRGSWGRGREHRRGIRLDYGGIDIEDLESGVRFLDTLGYVDRQRVGIWGSSYGGLMTTMSLFRKPGLYAAGVAGAPATNVRHALTGQMAVMMRPEDQPIEYDDSSPYLHGEGLEDPLMIVHGMRDPVVLYKDSVVLTQRLLTLGKDVDLVTLPDAGHGWDNEGLAQTRFAFRKMVDFFDRHLQPRERAGR